MNAIFGDPNSLYLSAESLFIIKANFVCRYGKTLTAKDAKCERKGRKGVASSRPLRLMPFFPDTQLELDLETLL
jgi:hypothetical protein